MSSIGFSPSLLRSTSCLSAKNTLANAECLDDIAKLWIIRTLKETGSWPMAEWLHDGGVTGSDPNVAIGKDDRILDAGRRGVNFVTLTGSSLTRHVALPDHGVGLDGQSCSCLIVGWPVDLSSPILGVGHPSVMFLFDCWPVGRPMPRMVRRCYRRPAHAKPKEPAIDKPMLMPTEASNVSPSGLVPSIEN
ncbi:hypothetical protein DY000_02006610 [Brassica cretica]|uniref:Uncharacterized protein n=2 Tax=Brassica cretica TaxID=69181 RepID=A0ABQ7CMH1_BRACR|nr:hypothetical protein DY000_02006610 [Brassica cretica]